MLTLIQGRGKTGKTRRLLELVRDCPAQGMARRIVIVPEQLSHQTERALSALCGDAVSFTSEVLSFTRLHSRVSSIYGGGARPVLDGGGRILTARLALDSVRSQLKVFGSAALKPEFLGSVVSMIDELKSYNVGPEVLKKAAEQTEGFFAQKLLELSVILGAYDAISARGACDPRDKLTFLRQWLLETDYALGRHFFVDGFTDFSARELGVLDALLRRSGDMTVALPGSQDPEEELFLPGQETAQRLISMAEQAGQEVRILRVDYHRPLPPALAHLEKNLLAATPETLAEAGPALHLLESPDPMEECRRCAAELRRYAARGLRWREMAVAVGNTATYAPLLEIQCREKGVPLYTSVKRPLGSHPAVGALLCALDAAAEGLDPETVSAWLRTGFSGGSDDDCDLLENYAFTWAIRGSRWQSPWTGHPDGYDGYDSPESQAELQRLNELRETVVAPLLRLYTGIRAGLNIQEQFRAIYRFLEETGFYEKVSAMAERQAAAGDQESAQETAQVYSALMDCLQQLVTVLGETASGSGELPQLLRTTLSQYQLGTIPAVLDAVHFGAVDSIRGMEPKVLFLLGTNENVIPGTQTGGSLLSERERERLLEELQLQLAPGSEGALRRQLLQVYSAMTAPTEALWVSWSLGGGKESLRPSYLVGRLRRIFPELPTESVRETTEDAMTVPELTELFLLALERGEMGLVESLRRVFAQAPELEQAVIDARSSTREREMTVPKELSERLFGSPVNLTASRLDQLGKCPLNFFLNYGLGARPRQEATFSPTEFGTFLHYILEKTVPALLEEETLPVSPERSGELVGQYMDVYLSEHLGEGEGLTTREKYLYSRNSREAEKVLRDISRELAVSAFRPWAYELKFGGGAGQEDLIIHSALGRGRLKGTVDRVDLWQTPQGSFYRVVDYKTGTSTHFSYTSLSGGLGLQLFLYLFALQRTGLPRVSGDLHPAGAMYYAARRNFVSTDTAADEEAVQKALRKIGVKSTGLVLEDEEVVEAMEPGAGGEFVPAKRTKSGMGSFAISNEQMELLRKFMERKLGDSLDRIYTGGFNPEPYYRGPSQDPCRVCEYGDVCQKDPAFRRGFYHPTLSPKEFWAMIGGEDNG